METLPTMELDTPVIDVNENDVVITTQENNENIQISDTVPVVADDAAKATYELFVEKGIFAKDDTYDGTWDSLEKNITELPNKIMTDIVNNAPDITKKVLEFVFTAGNNITDKELREFVDLHIKEQTAETIDTADDARSFLENVYKEKGLRASAIDAQLNDLEDEGKLMEEAKAEYDKTKKQTDKLIESKDAITTAQLEAQRQFSDAFATELKNTNWDSKHQVTVASLFKDNKFNTVMDEVLKNPKALVQLGDILTKYDSKTKTFNFESITRKAESNAATSIKNRFEQIINERPSTKATGTNPNSLINTLTPIL